MKLLMLIPPAQAEALFDALEEQPEQRFSARPWQDDDGLEEASASAALPPPHTGNRERPRRLPQLRAA